MSTSDREKNMELRADKVLETLLDRTDLSDVTLEGTDGIRVYANRAVLAVKSPVFHRMLYGKFAESGEKVVKIGYTGAVLRTLLQYVYTGSLHSGIFYPFPGSGKEVRTTVSLLDAANYLGLPLLQEKVESQILGWIKKYRYGTPCVPVLVLDQARKLGENASRIKGLAMDVIREDLKRLVDKADFGSVHPYTMESILEDDLLMIDELSLFRFLKKWVEAETYFTFENGSKQSRTEIGASLVSHLQLEHIDPSELSSTVSASKLVTSEQLQAAFKSQERYEKGDDEPPYKKPRNSPPSWTHCKCSTAESLDENWALFDYLACPPMTSGIHTWSIRIHKLELSWDSATTLGIKYRGGSRKSGGRSCTLMQDGTICIDDRNAREEPRLEFREGSLVAFRLNLEDEDGTLSVSVDNGPMVTIQSGLRALLSTLLRYGGRGYFPSIYMKGLGEVRIRQLKSIESGPSDN